MSVINATPLLAAAGGDYQISRSVRLRSSASAYFNRTPASAGNRKTWTLSKWVKRGTLGARQFLMQIETAGNNNASFGIEFQANDKLAIDAWSLLWRETTQVFRDASAWYHIVLTVDTTQATANNRLRLYVNGVEVTSFSTLNNPAQNDDLGMNQAAATRIGSANAALYADGYLTDVNFIDGQALTPSSFGETDSITGVWKPKKYAGTYGTNGFYLNFSDNSAATAAAIGKDYSGNGNNWTPNNISVTAGVTYDSMLDVPTLYADGGNGRGNYAVVNPLSKGTSQTSVINGNLYAIPISGASNWGTVFSSIAIPTSGKWYIEATAQVYAGVGNSSSLGVVDSTAFIPTNTAILYTFTTGEGFDGILANLFSDYVSPISDGVQGTNVTGLTGTSINLMLALDVDNGKVYAGYNGTWLNSGNPAGGTGEVASRTFSANDVVAGHTSWNGTNDQSQYYNFGQRPFAYTPPTGFKALNTQNLPEPTIKKGNQYFDATLWTGNGTSQSIVNSGAMQPDLVWAKSRSNAYNNSLIDSSRGVSKALFSDLTNAEDNAPGYYVTAFNSNGFSVGLGTGANGNGSTYVGWQWKESPSAGFDIVTYTGTGAAQNIAHSLGVAPSLIITKSRSFAQSWVVGHRSIGWNNFLELNSTGAIATAASVWNNTAPTSSVFTVGSAYSNTQTYVAYLFAEVAGFSKFGSYTGNASADGAFIYCGFRPKFILIKVSSTTSSWMILDSARNTYNLVNNRLFPEGSYAEDTSANCDFLSNGFKWRGSNLGNTADTYIYAAFAENPFKNSLAR